MYDWAEFRHFRYLLAILEKQGFRTAAEELHTSQPNLTVQARQFQENSSVKLFRRLKDGRIRPTETGVAFIELARSLLEMREEVIDALIAIERGQVAARPDLVQIENAWRSPKEQRPGAIQLGHVRQIETVIDNPDAEPELPCAATKTGLIVYGKNVGSTLTICTDRNCPVHDPHAAAELAANPAPVMAPAQQEETEEEAAERERQYAERRKEFEDEQQRREEERDREFEREHAEREADRIRRDELRKTRQATFDRVLENAPAMFSAAQLRVFLSALLNLDPYDSTEDVAAYFVGDDDNNQQTPEEVLTSTLAQLPDDKLTGFALRLALTGHTGIPSEGEFDFLAEAEAVFALPLPKSSKPRNSSKPKKTPTLVKAPQKQPAPKKQKAA